MKLNWARARCVAVSWIVLVGCSKAPVVPVQAPPPEVTVSLPAARRVTEFYEYIGRTKAPEFVEVRARVSGYLTKVLFDDGKEVEASEPLFEIDKRPYQYALENAKARLQQAESQLTLAKLKLERNKALSNTNAISQQDLDEAFQGQANFAAEVESARAAIAQAELDLEFCTIKAPISGRLSQANVTVGNLISTNQIGAPPLTTIASVDPIHVLFDVDEAAVLRYREMRRQQGLKVEFTHIRDLNQEVFVSLSNDTDFPHKGFLDFVDNEVRTSTGTLLVRAELDNSNRMFAPGMFVRVRLPFGEPRDSLLVPDRAILNDQNIKYVLVVDENDVAKRVDIDTGVLDNGMRVVTSGLQASDRVIINGVQRARPGATVKPILQPLASSTHSQTTVRGE